jgi:hypothetical protein
MARLLIGSVCLLTLVVAGCGSPGPTLPQTYPAGGSVVYKGGTPMRGGSIQLTTSADPLLRILGEIQPDGTFTLNTLKDKAKAAGAPEGEYQVIVLPPLQGEHRGVPPINLPRPYKVEPRENRFKIELNVPPPRS